MWLLGSRNQLFIGLLGSLFFLLGSKKSTLHSLLGSRFILLGSAPQCISLFKVKILHLKKDHPSLSLQSAKVQKIPHISGMITRLFLLIKVKRPACLGLRGASARQRVSVTFSFRKTRLKLYINFYILYIYIIYKF